MKKLTAIVLICLLAFNWYGYRLLLCYLENRSDLAFQEKLDKQEYDSQDLVEVRVPLSLPYLADWNEFESYEGETTINGLHYRYVKRKLEKGDLVLLCVPNQHKDKIQNAEQDYFKHVNDLPIEKKAKNNQKPAKSNINDFAFLDLAPSCFDFLKPNPDFAIFRISYTSFKPSTPSQPPNALS